MLLVYIFFAFTFLLLCINYKANNQIDSFNNSDNSNCHETALEKCRVPSLDSHLCWNNEFKNCNHQMIPYSQQNQLNSNLQCTNNNLASPNNLLCECNNRSHDICPGPQKVSQKCYSQVYNTCVKK